MNLKHEMPQYIAEFIGTFFLVFFACGAVILHQVNPDAMAGLGIPIIFGGTVAIMIYATGHISGAHFNPAVTLAFWSIKRFPVFRIPGYLIAQFAGATLASFVHSQIWPEANHNFGMTGLTTSVAMGAVLEVILSFALMFVIVSVATDSRAVGELAGIAIGTTVAMCAFVGGPLTGASMNPARSFGPALLNGDMNLIWLYIIFPIIGTIIGAKIYEWMRCQKEVDGGHGCC